MWDFYIHLYLYVFHFHIYIYPILGNVMFPHFIFVGAVYNHTISTYYVSPHISTISIFILSIQNILCGDTNKSSPTLNHHPNLYISRPLDPQFTRGVPHHPWALLVQVFWFSLRLFSSPSGRYPFMPSGGEGIFLFFLSFLALSLGLYTSLLWLSGLYLKSC